MGFWDRAGKAETLLGLWDRVIQVITALGLAGWLTLGTASVIAGWIMRTLGATPYWVLIPSAVLTGVLVLNFFSAAKRALALRGVKKLDLAELGGDCVKLRTDMFEFLVNQQEMAPQRFGHFEGKDKEETRRLVHEEWAKGVAHSNRVRAKLVEKFASRVLAVSHQLRNAGIGAPDMWAFDHSAPAIAAYVGAVGELLKKGLLDEARKMDPNEIRRMHFYFG